MEKETALTITLPSEEQLKQDILAINKFQQVVHGNMVSGQDYGIIPGTTKPTLLKPGAEKIAKLLGLSDDYEIVDRQEDWKQPFFRYLIKCKLCRFGTNLLMSSGLGECNSMESKYRWRWLFQSALPLSLQGDSGKVERDKLVNRTIITKIGQAKQYRMDNDDIYSQVNTILKMAKKRALVDAALSAGRLSEVFTQDIEDMGNIVEGEATELPDETEHYCKVHKTNFFKKGNMRGYAHKIEGTDQWCNEGVKEKSDNTPDASPNANPDGETPPTDKKDYRDSDTLKNFNEYSKACIVDFPDVIKTSQDAVTYAGYKSRLEISNYPEAYRKIVEKRQKPPE